MNPYERVLRFTLRHGLLMAVFAILLIGASYFCYTHLGSDLLPAMDEGGFIFDYIMPAGSSLEETDRIAQRASGRLGDGDVILLHDADHYSARDSWRRTAEALPAILAAIESAGLRPAQPTGSGSAGAWTRPAGPTSRRTPSPSTGSGSLPRAPWPARLPP